MKDSDFLTKELFLPLTAAIGLGYFAWQMLRDVQARGETMTLSMWIAVAVMAAGSVYGFRTCWIRCRKYRAEHPAEAAPAQAPQEAPRAERPSFIVTGDRQEGAAAFARLIVGNRGLLKQFKTETYVPSFESYCDQLDGPLACLTAPEDTEPLAELLMDELEQAWKEARTKGPDFSDQLLVSVYLIPALLRAEHPLAEDFAHAFRESWKRRYPDSVFEIGTYEQICKGFEKKYGCFITTAVCASQGKTDDCYELTQFRAFRDGWLARQPEGRAMIEEYYAVAPAIVNLMKLQSDAPAAYRKLREDYLLPCLTAIEAEDNEGCLEIYRNMVRSLRETYLQ